MQRSPAKNAENPENTSICGLGSCGYDFALDFALKAAARSGS